MPANCVVAMRLMVLLLPVLLYAAPAMPQGNSEQSGSAQKSGIAPAPIGHRQPKVADIPKERPKDTTDEQREKLDRELDAKLRICRNC